MAQAKSYGLPLVRSPLEFGRWYTKGAFERRYRVRDWRTVVRFTDGRHAVRCGGFALIALLREHAVRCGGFALIALLREHTAAYFQLMWNARPHRSSIEVAVGTGRLQQWRPYPVTHAPGTTIRLRICYALTPQRDTEVVLYDGYGLPTRDRWWETIPAQEVVLTPPRQLAA